MNKLLHTNIAELPTSILLPLADSLVTNDLWINILDTNSRSAYYMSNDEIEKFKKQAKAGESLLRILGNRGLNLESLMKRMQEISQRFGGCMDIPQMVLKRKFVPVRWARVNNEIGVSVVNEGREIELHCRVVGFPSPSYKWFRDDELLEEEVSAVLVLPLCSCFTKSKYKCIAWNEVPAGYSFSNHYRNPDKAYSSSLTSNPIDISENVGKELCDRCLESERKELVDRLPDMSGDIEIAVDELTIGDGSLYASDKVALIISNCVYSHLPELVTPLCDAETLAMALQEMKFKTVTLADLTLQEMRSVVREYRRLLGEGVYAVFYFVGHGFEVNGQCYLLGIDAPTEPHHPDFCLSMDWLLAELSPFNPALNLLLLDVCRKYIPLYCNNDFVMYAEQFKYNKKPNRNTVYAYSTSGGIGAYEVRGEVNGVFMKYLKNHISKKVSVVDMINHVLRDIEEDKKVRDVQVPELRSTLTRPRSLLDALYYSGHTRSFDNHTAHWRQMHDLPTPAKVHFIDIGLTVTIWFDFCGHFTNKVYVFSSVGDYYHVDYEDDIDERKLSTNALNHRAFLKFPQELETSNEKIFEDDEEGVSICILLSHLQRVRGPVKCAVELKHKDHLNSVVATMETNLGHVLITSINLPRF